MASWLAVRFALLVSCLACVPMPSMAQDAAVLQGRLIDGSGAALVGAGITARNDTIRFALSVRTNAHGHYRLPALAA